MMTLRQSEGGCDGLITIQDVEMAVAEFRIVGKDIFMFRLKQAKATWEKWDIVFVSDDYVQLRQDRSVTWNQKPKTKSMEQCTTFRCSGEHCGSPATAAQICGPAKLEFEKVVIDEAHRQW